MMSSLAEFILIYTVGGLTFPLVLALLIFLHAYLTLPVHDDAAHLGPADPISEISDDLDTINNVVKNQDQKLTFLDGSEAEEAAGYFTVSRDYIPGGVNGRPPERSTPIGSTTVSAPSPSVYQSMYRSIFERKPPSGQPDRNTGRPSKKGGNIFYLVLRHGYLMLFDDDEQLEVRHVVSIAQYDVTIHSGEEEIPEGELFIKRNAICLSRRTDLDDIVTNGQTSKPFFLFSENCSQKEDFYFALLRNQGKQPKPLQYEVRDIISLVQRLHSSEEHIQTRWINAIMGRVFLALYKTSEVESYVRAKINKKISRVKTPTFLSKIVLKNIDMGQAAPIITNPKLKNLTVQGELMVEADLRYSGNFRIEVAATARIDLGSRFRAREVNLLLAVNIKRIEGHMLLRIKPPPSNRFWVCFQTQPKIDMTIEPIVSSRQITYPLILRQIENRIKEVVAESLVFPNWDDSPFFGTENKTSRGGIWDEDVDKVGEIFLKKDEPVIFSETTEDDKAVTDIELEESQSSISQLDTSTPLVPIISPSLTHSKKSSELQSSGPERSPKLLRSGSFSSLSGPVVGTDSITVDAFKGANHTEQCNAKAALSQMSSPTPTTMGSPLSNAKSMVQSSRSSISSNDDSWEKDTQSESEVSHIGTTNSTRSTNSSKAHSSFKSLYGDTSNPSATASRTTTSSESRREISNSSSGRSSTADFKRLSLTTMTNAASTAKKWGLNALQRNSEQKNDHSHDKFNPRPLVMGRGQPLPPPGVPLPPPGKKISTVPASVSKRRPMTPSSLLQISQEDKLESKTENQPLHAVTPSSILERRKQEVFNNSVEANDELLIISAPLVDVDSSLEGDQESPPGSPILSQPFNEPTRQSLTPERSASLEGNNHEFSTWITAHEQESRSKSVLVEEEINLP